MYIWAEIPEREHHMQTPHLLQKQAGQNLILSRRFSHSFSLFMSLQEKSEPEILFCYPYLSTSWLGLLSHLKSTHNQKPARSIFLLNQVNMTLIDVSVVAHCEYSKTRQGTGCVWDRVWRMQVIHEPICAKCLLVTRWWAWDIQTFSYSMESAELMREHALSNTLYWTISRECLDSPYYAVQDKHWFTPQMEEW